MTSKRRRLVGTVVSNKMDKTVVVRIDRSYRHPLYGKVVRDSNKFMAHDEENKCEMGDTVMIVESRPLSRHKRWVVQEILGQSASARTVAVEDVVTPEIEAAAEEELAATEDQATEPTA